MTHGRRIAELLLELRAVKLSVDEPFTWTSGIKSPIYCDARLLYGYPIPRTTVVDALAMRVRNLHIPPDAVAGTATAAIGWAALVADRLNLPFVYVRPKAKEHGERKRVEGFLKPEQHIVVVEDLLSTGGSSMATVQALRDEARAIVTDVVSIFSYEFLSAVEGAQTMSVHLHPLTTISTLLAVALERDDITESQMRLIQDFMRNPERWGQAVYR